MFSGITGKKSCSLCSLGVPSKSDGALTEAWTTREREACRSVHSCSLLSGEIMSAMPVVIALTPFTLVFLWAAMQQTPEGSAVLIQRCRAWWRVGGQTRKMEYQETKTPFGLPLRKTGRVYRCWSVSQTIKRLYSAFWLTDGCIRAGCKFLILLLHKIEDRWMEEKITKGLLEKCKNTSVE